MNHKINILAVDDEQIILDSIRKHLRQEKDFDLRISLNVDKGLKILDDYDIDIILTDLMMPQIDGLQFLDILRQKDKKYITIMITGYATINTAIQATQLGAFDYIAKPFTREELRNLLNRAAKLVLAQRMHIEDNKVKQVEPVNKIIKAIGEHCWMVLQEDDTVLIGAERAFIINAGSIEAIYLPSEGDILRQGSSFFQAFSEEMSQHSLQSPISGRVVEVNSRVLDNYDLILNDPYGDGWLIRLAPDHFEEQRKGLGL